MTDDGVITHRDIVWSLPESIRYDFVVMADELAHHKAYLAELSSDPGSFWSLPLWPAKTPEGAH